MIRRPLVLILLSLIAGILLAPHQPHNILTIMTLLTGIILLCVVYPVRPSPHIEALAIVATFLATGIIISEHNGPDPLVLSIITKNKRQKFEATVLDPVVVRKGVGRLNVRIQRVYVRGKPENINCKARVTVYNNVPPIFPGQRILFSARPRKFRNFQNPGNFDYQGHMLHKGFAFSAPVSDGRRIVPLGKGYLPFPRNLAEQMRRPVRDFLNSTLQGPDLAIYSAIVLGDRNLISSELRERFSRAGLNHVLAVSGLHIGLVAWIAFFLIRTVLLFSHTLSLRLDVRKAAALFTCVPILAYVSLSGFQVSATRAMIMAMAFLWSLILGREKDIWSTLCLSGLVILFIEPDALFQISFQLSYLAVVGLIWLCPRLFSTVNPLVDKYLPTLPSVIKRSCLYIISLGIITITATVFLLPVTVYYFNRISLVAFPANFAVIPLLGLVVIPLGLVSALAYPAFPGLAKLILLMGAKGIHAILWIVETFDMIPLASIWFVTPSMLEIGLFYGALFFIFFRNRKRWAKPALVAICALALVDAGYWVARVKYNKELRISFLDVGQGNSALVEFPGGKKMLIDGGGFYRETFDVGRMVVAPFLWSQKISKIDYLVLTHPQSDHMNGLRFIANTFDPEIFYFNGDQVQKESFKQLMQILKHKRTKVIVPQHEAEKLKVGNVLINFLALRPSDFHNPVSATLNNRSLIVLINYGNYRIMFPGDIEKEAEKILVERDGSRLRSQILLSPHHGSKTSSSSVFLKAVRPQVCVISCRGNSRLGFPDKVVLDRLAKMECIVLRTDNDGMVSIIIKGNRLEVKSFRSHFKTIYTLTSHGDPGKRFHIKIADSFNL